MTLRVKKPELNIREQLNKLDRPVGQIGAQILKSDNADDLYSAIGRGRKNIIINGNMLVGQRDRAISSSYNNPNANNQYILDKWKNRPYGSTPHTITRNSVLLPNGDYAYSLHVLETGNGGAGFWHIINTFEIERWMLGQVFTVSYWYRTNSPTVQPRYCDTSTCQIIPKTMTSDGEWHKMVHEVNINQAATVGSNGQLHPAFNKENGDNLFANEFIEFAQVQMELGKVATPFEHRSYNEELKLCQRYFQKMGIGTSGYSNSSGSAVSFAFRFFTNMRIEPTVSINNTTFAFADTFVAMRNASSPSISYNGFSSVSGSEVTGGELQITTGTTTTASNFQQLYSEDAIWFDADF